jgi:hypothetical protein
MEEGGAREDKPFRRGADAVEERKGRAGRGEREGRRSERGEVRERGGGAS